MWIRFHYRFILIEIQALMIPRVELGCTRDLPILLGQNQARCMQVCFSLFSRCDRLLYALVLNDNHIDLGPSIRSCIEVSIFENQFGAEF